MIDIVMKDLSGFAHRNIDSDKTKVEVLKSKDGSFYLNVALYDRQGNYVVEDIKILPGHPKIPGVTFGFKPTQREVVVESLYINPTYNGQGIGTALVMDLFKSARRMEYRKACLVADKSDTLSYWVEKHGFVNTDPSRPRFLEKEL